MERAKVLAVRARDRRRVVVGSVHEALIVEAAGQECTSHATSLETAAQTATLGAGICLGGELVEEVEYRLSFEGG